MDILAVERNARHEACDCTKKYAREEEEPPIQFHLVFCVLRSGRLDCDSWNENRSTTSREGSRTPHVVMVYCLAGGILRIGKGQRPIDIHKNLLCRSHLPRDGAVKGEPQRPLGLSAIVAGHVNVRYMFPRRIRQAESVRRIVHPALATREFCCAIAGFTSKSRKRSAISDEGRFSAVFIKTSSFDVELRSM
jgi:hypothetical protein